VLIKDHSDVEQVKGEVRLRNMIIARITPLANDCVEDATIAVNEFYMFIKGIGDDINFRGEEKLVITPQDTRVWRKIKER